MLNSFSIELPKLSAPRQYGHSTVHSLTSNSIQYVLYCMYLHKPLPVCMCVHHAMTTVSVSLTHCFSVSPETCISTEDRWPISMLQWSRP